MDPESPCLPLTGTGDNLLIATVGAALLIGGIALVVLSRRSRSNSGRSGHAGLAARCGMAVLLAVPALVGLAGGPAFGSDGCPPETAPPRATAPAGTKPTTEPTTPPPTTSPEPPEARCPAGNDIATLPAGQSIAWKPVVVPDPTEQPGQPGDAVQVWEDGISGYTWHVVGDGPPSGDCPGRPNDGGTCVQYPQPVSYVIWAWDESAGEWVETGGTGTTNGCGGGGGNN
ncbi:LPXTG cell wall anchor domain-containing protein [Phytomonospora sp. NPDC050363]|uniref:LPXTG cell wall anchor domain-containing protein n=1 Tax=Phytomonospora sp. NPDC050363 TaxID=3155642 RepID=UPI0033DF9FBC